ncbi:TetR/AcrR family transcriptional regulator [Sphaerisporangium sp. NPDC051011]|uniref:TetR/AcrR family transcriptional regulator n=1 Tax=Sphaerisporangium sp. NPDC051011 TaxID=3155792 RepID=UPI0033E2E5DE
MNGSAAGTPREKDEPVRRRLLGAATRLFADKGFEGTSVQEIVAAAGVTKGAMYHYFGSKDDLLREIYARVLRMQTERLDRFADAPGPVATRVYDAAVDVIATTIENLDDSKIFFRSMHQLTPETQQAVRAERRRYHERFRDLVAEGQRTKVFRDDVPADLVVDFFFGSVHHLGLWYHTEGPLSGVEIGRHFAGLLLTSLRPGDDPGPASG